jgi:hypothetical protein
MNTARRRHLPIPSTRLPAADYRPRLEVLETDLQHPLTAYAQACDALALQPPVDEVRQLVVVALAVLVDVAASSADYVKVAAERWRRSRCAEDQPPSDRVVGRGTGGA